MKECTLEANLEGQVAIKIVHHFVDSNLGVEIYAWKGGKLFTLGKEGFAWRTRGKGELYRNFPYTLKVHSTDCFRSIVSLTKNAYFSRISFSLDHSSVS